VSRPAGEKATGGGHNIAPNPDQGVPPVVVTQSLPLVENDVPVGWAVAAAKISPSAQSWTLVAAVLCAPA
jgi:hypothetical protein